MLRDARGLLGSAAISRGVRLLGAPLRPRTVRQYLSELEHEGLVTAAKRGRSGGRGITPEGIAQVADAFVHEQVALASSRVDALAWQVTLDLAARIGRVVVDVALLSPSDVRQGVSEMVAALAAGLGVGEYGTVRTGSEQVGHLIVPPGSVALVAISSVTLNGMLLSARIPTQCRFAGLLELRQGVPVRFCEVVGHDGTSLDPSWVLARSGQTSVRQAARTGTGRIVAVFCEIPTAAIDEAERVFLGLRRSGLGCLLQMGRPGEPLLGIPVRDGRTGFVLLDGVNPLAAIAEAGVTVSEHRALELYEYGELCHHTALGVGA